MEVANAVALVRTRTPIRSAISSSISVKPDAIAPPVAEAGGHRAPR